MKKAGPSSLRSVGNYFPEEFLGSKLLLIIYVLRHYDRYCDTNHGSHAAQTPWMSASMNSVFRDGVCSVTRLTLPDSIGPRRPAPWEAPSDVLQPQYRQQVEKEQP